MDTPQVLLDHHLKTLRLPTFLREYDKVAQQCAAEGVDFPRYLLRLSELELLDRERRATERRIRQAKFDVVKSLDTFEFLSIPSLNKSLSYPCTYNSASHPRDSGPGTRPEHLPASRIERPLVSRRSTAVLDPPSRWLFR